jgi:hypothetical protein
MTHRTRLAGSAANSFFFLAGLLLRVLNKIRHRVMGYTTPRPFTGAPDTGRDAAYTLDVVTDWLEALRAHTGRDNPFKGKDVLELGPGPDLGTGLVILALGARSYTAMDKYNLAAGARPEFYRTLSARLSAYPAFYRAREAVEAVTAGRTLPWFSYLHSPGFRVDRLPQGRYHLAVSRAVLEHMDEIPAVFRALKAALARGGLMIHEVDLGTHTRWIRRVDPLNLLRYPETVYTLLKWDGAPNRLRMSEYKHILRETGFSRISAEPLATVGPEYLKRVTPGLAERFKRYAPDDLAVRSFRLLAAKEGM